MKQAVLLFEAETWVVTPEWERTWGVSDPVSYMADKTAPAEDNGRDVEIYLGSVGKGGSRFLDDGVIRQAAPEYGCKVYR